DVPAAHDARLELAPLQPAVNDHEKHIFALRRELVRHLGLGTVPDPRVGEGVHGLQASDDALGDVPLADLALPVLLGCGLLAREARVVELEAALAADAQVELARGEPFRALVGLGDVGPDPLERPGQEALEAHGAGLDEGDGWLHGFLLRLGWGGVEDSFRAASIASSARRAASRESRRADQNSRVFSIHWVRSSNGFGSSARKWSRPETRRRTSPARSRRRMC